MVSGDLCYTSSTCAFAAAHWHERPLTRQEDPVIFDHRRIDRPAETILLSAYQQFYIDRPRDFSVSSDHGLLWRGIADAAADAGWRKISTRDGHGFQIPYCDLDGQQFRAKDGVGFRHRWQREDGKRTWGGHGKPPGASTYHLPDFKSYIASAGGECWLVEGETSALSLIAVGMLNVAGIFGAGETKAISAEYCWRAGISKLIVLMDNDAAGAQAARRIRDNLHGTGIDCEFRSLAMLLGDKGDPNDLLELSLKLGTEKGFDWTWFRAAIGRLPHLELPAYQPPAPSRTYHDAPVDPDWQTQHATLVQQVSQALGAAGRVDSSGWYVRRIACPIHGGEDHNAQLSATTGNIQCHSRCGLIKWPRVFDAALGESWRISRSPQHKTQPGDMPEAMVDDPHIDFLVADDTQPQEPPRLPTIAEQAMVFSASSARVTSHTYVADALDSIDISGAKLVGIRSPLGSGKTTAMQSYIEDLLQRQPDARVLVITPFRSLCASLTSRYGFQSYDKLSWHAMREAQLLVICNPSIVKLHGAEAYDLIVIDEIDHILNQPIAPHLFAGESPLLWAAAMRYLLSLAKQTIVLSAHLTRFDIAHLHSLTGKASSDTIVLDNKPELLSLNCYRYRNRDQILLHAFDLASNRPGKPILIFCGSAATATAMRDYFADKAPDLRVKAFFTDTSRTGWGQSIARDINAGMKELDVLIYTTSLSTGIDFTGACAGVYGIFDNPNLSPFVKMQSMMRSRHADQYSVYLPDAPESQDQSLDRLVSIHAGIIQSTARRNIGERNLSIADDMGQLLDYHQLHSYRAALNKVADFHHNIPIIEELMRMQNIQLVNVAPPTPTP
ncbi:MAG: hypothetical protein F4X51_10085, partial [Gemmatimonadetes bacterium]|nr:hypothetical protein [Gemmatimonadota bacterium]